MADVILDPPTAHNILDTSKLKQTRDEYLLPNHTPLTIVIDWLIENFSDNPDDWPEPPTIPPGTP